MSLALRTGTSSGPAVVGGYLRGPKWMWVALFANVLAFQHFATVVPIPGPVGQLVAQGALPLALVLGLLANPTVVVRPNVYLALLTVMGLLAFMVSIHSAFLIGATYRASRLLGFILVLWLTTPWWGNPDFPLLRAHLACLRVALYTVGVGVVLAPGKAFAFEGRLQGVIWPIPATQVAHYAAVLAGCTAVLWFCELIPGRTAAFTVAGSFACLVGAHTRTAIVAMAVGLVIAGASLFLGHARVRRTAAISAVVVGVVGTFFTPLIIQWASRGQSAQEAAQLTGRTKVWNAVLGLQRPWNEWLFGLGLSNKSYQGLPIDSNWIASYYDEGWVGVAVQVAFLLSLALFAVTRPRGPRRAVALFLLSYCVVASFTETGLGDASPYLLDLAVAASLLSAPAWRSRT